MDLTSSGRSWAIAAPHTLATTAGAEMFERGGNAIDAALAAAITLAVTCPNNCGVGGDLFAVVERGGHDGGDTLVVRSAGRAAAAGDPDALRARHGDVMPARGPDPVTVPGAVAGWQRLHEMGGRLPWSDLFATAIGAAVDGITIPASTARRLAHPDAGDVFGNDPGMASIFFPAGKPMRTGSTLHQPELGRTLETLAAGGAEALYEGPVGAAYIEGLRAAGSPLTVDDLASHEAVIVPPLTGAWRGLHVGVAPPSSQGYSLLQILAVAERLELDPDPCGPDTATWARVFLEAEHDVRRHLGDPATMTTSVTALLDDGHLAAFADAVRDGKPAGSERPADLGSASEGAMRSPNRPDGDTIALVAADADGHAITLIQSLFLGFGAGILEPTTGIVAHDRGACFTLAPGQPGTFAPGSVPPHTLCPVVLHDRQGLAGVVGTMGGFQQPQIVAQVLAALVALGHLPGDALARPRWIVDDLPHDGTVPGVSVERAAPEGVAAAIEAAGFTVTTLADLHDDVGHTQAIVIRDGMFHAGADPRADGGALAG